MQPSNEILLVLQNCNNVLLVEQLLLRQGTKCQLHTYHCCAEQDTVNYRVKGKVMFSQVSVCPQSASWILALLRRGRYASSWNAFLL